MSDPIQATSDVAKATEQVAKTTGQLVETTGQLGRFVAKYVAGPLQLTSGIVQDKLAYMRWENQIDLIQRAEAKLKAIGLSEPTRTVPPKLAIPLLQAASLEDDASLRDVWATLLVNGANAASGIDLKRAYISILENLTPFEAVILAKIYALPFDQIQHNGAVTGYLPERAAVNQENSLRDESLPKPTEEVVLALANLARLGCVTLGRTFGGGEVFDSVTPTTLGRHFVDACTLQD